MKAGREHVVDFHGSFHYLADRYLVFNCAEDNLNQFWEGSPSPKLTAQLLEWASSQITGLAQALAAIHDDLKGAHGDIAPHNILRFPGPAKEELGTLKFADFEMAQFPSTPKQDYRSTGSTFRYFPLYCDPTYEPPEYRLNMNDPANVILPTRQSDVWSFGGVLLDFVTWLLCGLKGVREFSAKRQEEQEKAIKVDSFFKLGNDSRTRPQLKKSVIDWMNKLNAHNKRSEWTNALVDLIQNGMMQTNPSKRSASRQLSARLLKLDENLRRPTGDSVAKALPNTGSSSTLIRQRIHLRYPSIAKLAEALNVLFDSGNWELEVSATTIGPDILLTVSGLVIANSSLTLGLYSSSVGETGLSSCSLGY